MPAVGALDNLWVILDWCVFVVHRLSSLSVGVIRVIATAIEIPAKNIRSETPIDMIKPSDIAHAPSVI